MADNEKTFQARVIDFFNQCFERLDNLENEEDALAQSTGTEAPTAENVKKVIAFKKYKIATLEKLLGQYKLYKNEAVKLSVQGEFLDDLLQLESDIVRELNGVRNELNALQGYNIL